MRVNRGVECGDKGAFLAPLPGANQCEQSAQADHGIALVWLCGAQASATGIADVLRTAQWDSVAVVIDAQRYQQSAEQGGASPLAGPVPLKSFQRRFGGRQSIAWRPIDTSRECLEQMACVGIIAAPENGRARLHESEGGVGRQRVVGHDDLFRRR